MVASTTSISHPDPIGKGSPLVVIIGTRRGGEDRGGLGAVSTLTCCCLFGTLSRYLAEEVTITGDVADAPIAHFAKIKASLVEPPRHPAHMSFESWRKVYR